MLDAIFQTLLVAALAAMAAAGEDAGAEADTRARRVLAERLEVPADSFELVSVERSEWGDTSLGCPEKGMVYAQVVTSGYRVLLRLDDKVHDVRIAGESVVVCAPGRSRGAPRPERTLRGTATGSAYRTARRELAARLGIAEREVAVTSIRPVGEGGDPACRPAAVDPSMKADGSFVVELAAAGETYRYLSDGTRAVPCEARPGGSATPKGS